MSTIKLYVDTTVEVDIHEDVEFDIDAVLAEIDTSDLIDELKKRKGGLRSDSHINDLTTLHKDEIKRYLENLFYLSHVLSVDELLQEIKSYIQ